MSTTESLSTADRLLAIEEIKALSARYALGLDEYDMEKLLTAYSDDVVFDASAFGLGSFTGHAELQGFFQHTFDVMKEQMHLFSNFIVELEGPDAASGTNYLYEDGFTHEGAQITCLCLNRDKYVRENDGWRIAERVIQPLVMPKLEGYNE
jgi:ketosteroid isomerase-like protein